MKMDLYPQVIEHCSMPVAAEVRSLAGGTPQGSDALVDILWDRGLADDCLASILGCFANRIGLGTEPDFVTVYFTTAGDLAHANPPMVREAIAAAATRAPFGRMPEAGVSVFGALRADRIDIRPASAETTVSDWSFVRPQAPTWKHHLYLADLGTPGAVTALAEKIAATTNGNEATNLLKSLATVRNDEVRVVLETYRDDRRHSDAPDGPGLTIAETVGFLLRNCTIFWFHAAFPSSCELDNIAARAQPHVEMIAEFCAARSGSGPCPRQAETATPEVSVPNL